MKTKFKQWWSTSPLISIKQTITSNLWTQKEHHICWIFFNYTPACIILYEVMSGSSYFQTTNPCQPY